jgi:hypothetical protein
MSDSPNPSLHRARRFAPWLGLILVVLAAQVSLAGPGAAKETLRFRVYLDRNPIGEHSFHLSDLGNGFRQVLSRASFDVDILIFNAYRYRHESREQWRGGCLERISASTDDNGKAFRVQGERAADGLSLDVNGNAQRLAGCVGSFAYWAPDLLKQPRLLNPQTGELVAVRLEPAGSDRRRIKGRDVQANRYRLRADNLDISLWYTADGDWVGLESDTGKGRTLRYERI